jgi:hypothetical protein
MLLLTCDHLAFASLIYIVILNLSYIRLFVVVVHNIEPLKLRQCIPYGIRPAVIYNPIAICFGTTKKCISILY